MQVPFPGVWQFPDSPALCCLPVHCTSIEPPEEHDGLYTVIQCHGSDLLHGVHVRGEYRCWECCFPIVLTQMFPLGQPAGAGLKFKMSFLIISAASPGHNEWSGCLCSWAGGGGEVETVETGQWVCKLLHLLGTAVAQITTNHKSSCGLFCLLVSYNLGLWTLNQRMEDVGKSAWKQKDFHHALAFCLENLSASNL